MARLGVTRYRIFHGLSQTLINDFGKSRTYLHTTLFESTLKFRLFLQIASYHDMQKLTDW